MTHVMVVPPAVQTSETLRQRQLFESAKVEDSTIVFNKQIIMASDDWKSPGFRQNVAARIEEAIRQSGNPTTKTASEMETHFFQRANNKEDYLNYLARLLIHIKELSAKARAQGGTGVGVAGPQGNVQPNNPQQQGNISQPQMMNHMNVRPQMMQNMGGMDPQQQMNQMAPNQQHQMNQMAPNQQQQMNQQQHQQMNQMAMNQQQMNQMGVNQQLNQQQQMNQFNPNNNPNMNIGNPMMQQQQQQQQQQQLGAPNQQQQQPQGNVVNNPSSALISQLNQNQQQQAMGPMGGGMPRPRFAGPIAGVTATAKMTPQQQQQVQAQAQQQQQILSQQMLIQQQRKQQAEMIQNPTTPQQFVGGPGVPSPAQQQQQPMQSMQQQQQQQQQQPMSSGMTSHMSAPSPAYVHSPGNVQLVSSPAAAARMGGQQQQQQQQRSLSSLLPPPSPNMMNVPTPGGGGMLHTPQGAGMGGMGMTGAGGGMMGSGGGGTEEQMYLEKVRQLSRFIEPLTCLIGRIGDVDSEKLSKMKIMLDILSNPSKRMPMDTLLKCEAVLEKMDFKKSESGSVAPPSVASVPSLGVAVPATTKDNPPAATPLLSLLETIANQARSPYINHTLQRTFAPAVNSLIGCDIAAPSAPKKRLDSADDDKADELMFTIEREVANLYPRFKVDLDQLHLFGSQDLHLICRLEDKYLPSVPSLRIVVPRDYPRTAPFCDSRQPDYDVSGFTRTVLQGLSDRLRHMPHRFTVSQILNCWEMALRHACKPSSGNNNNNASNRDVSALTAALGV